ncbi:MAG: lysine--tRNA ligase [Candidatus Thorarchaeota archaeon]
MTQEEAPEDEFSIHWIEDVVNDVLEREMDTYLISSGKSPSGSIHIGFVRELIVGDVIKRELERRGKKARTMFVVDDFDPLRSFPPSTSLSPDEWMGTPYSDVPDEFGCCESFGAHWANELVETFPAFGLDPEVVWTHRIYETPEMLDAVRKCLKNTETIREIMIEFVASAFSDEQKQEYVESMKTWYPASVVCPQCGKLQAGGKGSIVPNRVLNYDEESDIVTFKCPACGFAGNTPLSETRVKLVWRIDWPAKWYVLKVTCEPAGKDHSVKGGSYDTGLEVSKRVFEWSGPVKVPYEWVRIGGRDMSTSEGIVFTPRSWLEIAPPELYRYLMLKTDLARAVNIQPDRIPDMIDEYDRFERIYYGLEEVDEEKRQLARLIYPLCVTGPIPDKYVPKLPFRFAVTTSQLEGLLGEDAVMEQCEQVIRKKYGLDVVSEEARNLIPIRLRRARNWAQEFGTDRDRIEVPETVPPEVISTLTEKDLAFLKEMVEVLEGGTLDDEALQGAVFERARKVGLKEKRAFVVLYRIIISKKYGPRLGPFLNLLGNAWVLKRINSVL